MINCRFSTYILTLKVWDSTRSALELEKSIADFLESCGATRLVGSLFFEHPVRITDVRHRPIFSYLRFGIRASEPDRIWSGTLGFIQSRLMSRFNYYRYYTGPCTY